MTDYAAMSDAELNRAIAEKREYLLSAIDPNNWTVLDPDRMPITGYHTYPAQAWEAVPNWAGDVGEAMKLLESESDYIIQKDSEDEDELRYSVQIGFVNPSGLRGGCRTYGESLPRAIAECWLMLKEAEK